MITNEQFEYSINSGTTLTLSMEQQANCLQQHAQNDILLARVAWGRGSVRTHHRTNVMSHIYPK